MKLLGIDLNKDYTDEELAAIEIRLNAKLRKLMLCTIVLCASTFGAAYLIKLFQ